MGREAGTCWNTILWNRCSHFTNLPRNLYQNRQAKRNSWIQEHRCLSTVQTPCWDLLPSPRIQTFKSPSSRIAQTNGCQSCFGENGIFPRIQHHFFFNFLLSIFIFALSIQQQTQTNFPSFTLGLNSINSRLKTQTEVWSIQVSLVLRTFEYSLIINLHYNYINRKTRGIKPIFTNSSCKFSTVNSIITTENLPAGKEIIKEM